MSPVTPAQILADAERQMKEVRAEMLQLSLPLHAQWFPGHGDHNDLAGRERENKIIGEVLYKISDEHAQRDHLMDAVNADIESIKQFIRDKLIDHKDYVREHGEDMPEVRYWKWRIK